MKWILAVLAVSLSFVLFNCSSEEAKEAAVDETVVALDGKSLTAQNCYSCHSPDAAHDNRVAPPLFAVRKHYQKKFGSKEEFVAAVVDFVQYPSADKAIMKGAVKKFGPMPAMQFDADQLQAIATYLYETEFEHPHQGSDEEARSPLQQGKEYALATKSVLGKNLMGALNRLPTHGALDFCNTRAISITDSMSADQNVSIQRVSDQNRNPDNKAQGPALAYILKSKELLAAGKEILPELRDENDKYIGYYPILTNQMCLQCHGTPQKDIDESTLNKIAELYPDDKATGYGINELRGIWVVEWDKN